MGEVTVIQHPVVQHLLTQLRDERTGSQEFRHLLANLASLLTFEATRTLEVRSAEVRTPVGEICGSALQREILLVPILRAGLGMVEAMRQLLPHPRVGFIGMKRNEHTLQCECYHQSLPAALPDFEVILLDPMLATGGSSVAALGRLRELGATRIRLVNLVAAPEGIAHVHRHHPEVPIFTAAIDQKLNARGYIVPGLGDAGDRLFGV